MTDRVYAGLGWDVLRGGEQGRVGLLLISPDASVVCVFLPMPIGGQARYFLFAVFTKDYLVFACTSCQNYVIFPKKYMAGVEII